MVKFCNSKFLIDPACTCSKGFVWELATGRFFGQVITGPPPVREIGIFGNRWWPIVPFYDGLGAAINHFFVITEGR